MPRARVSCKKTRTKREFRGNQHKKLTSTHRPSQTSSSGTRVSQDSVSSASRKLSFDKYDSYEGSGSGSVIFDLSLLSENIKKFTKCKFCNSEDCIELDVSDRKRFGLAVNIELKCLACFESINFHNSTVND